MSYSVLAGRRVAGDVAVAIAGQWAEPRQFETKQHVAEDAGQTKLPVSEKPELRNSVRILHPVSMEAFLPTNQPFCDDDDGDAAGRRRRPSTEQ